jgi:hypothetical protein
MPDEELIQRVVNAARRLAQGSPSGEISGEEVAQALRIDPGDSALYDALRVAERRGRLDCEAWEGGMGLPATIRVE